MPDPGWLIIYKKHRADFVNLKGSHGYDLIHESMNTIFFAKGPAFKKGVLLKAFESVNVVPLLAHLLGIEAKPNNGSLDVFKDVLTNFDDNNDFKLSDEFSNVLIVCLCLVLSSLGNCLLFI